MARETVQSLMAKALMETDPAKRQVAEDKALLASLAIRTQFCRFSGLPTFFDSTVVLDGPSGVITMHASHFDNANQDGGFAELAEAEGFRILDGRVLFAKKSAKSNV